MDLPKKIETILFFRGEPISKKNLAKLTGASDLEVNAAVEELKNAMRDRGVILIDGGEEVMLGTSPDLSELIESISKEDTEKDLTKAALETLSIILYRAPVSRSEIDFIRGVNSTFILRNLLVRGLIKRKLDVGDKRSYVYEPSLHLLAHLGVPSVNEIPQYQEVADKIESFLKTSSEEDQKEDSPN